MAWSNEEIVWSYKTAADKGEQVRILAELTCSDTQTILAILHKAGVVNDGDFVSTTCECCGAKIEILSKSYKRLCPNCRMIRKDIVDREVTLKRWAKDIQKHLRDIAQLENKSIALREEIEEMEKCLKGAGNDKRRKE